MKQKIIVWFAFFMLVTSSASAHVMNRDNMYRDIAMSEMADAIVFATSLGIIRDVENDQQFKPSTTLTMKTLAAWYGAFQRLDGTNEHELATAAVAVGYVSTIEGNATYADVNQLYFDGQLALTNEQATLTRAEFAEFITTHAMTVFGEETLLAQAAFTAGPTGVVEAVNKVDTAYVLTIGGKPYTLGMHPSIIGNSVDPSIWTGQYIAQSFFAPNHTSDMHSHDAASQALQFIVLGDTPFITAISEVEEDTTATSLQTIEQALIIDEEPVETSSENNRMMWLVMFGVGAIVIGSLYMYKRKSLK